MARSFIPPNPPRPKSTGPLLIRKPYLLIVGRLVPAGVTVGRWRRYPQSGPDCIIADVQRHDLKGSAWTNAVASYSEAKALEPDERVRFLHDRVIEAARRIEATEAEIAAIPVMS